MRYLPILLAAAIAGLAAPASANDRYGARPPLVVSPDLSAPWVLQLRQSSSGRATLRVAPQPRAVYQQPQPVYQQQQVYQQSQPAYQQLQRQQQQQVRQQQPAQVQTASAAANIAASHPEMRMDPMYLPREIAYDGKEAPGTIIIDTTKNFLFLVQKGGKARRYGVGTGKPGFEWAGTHKITEKRQWPDWRPPQEMIAREAKKGHVLPAHMEGGPSNPLGARAMYLGSTLYRIHGTNAPWTIGHHVSSGCIRMRNEDVIDLYERVGVGTKVVVI